MPSDHTRIHSHYMAAHPVDADPPTNLRFTSTKPKLATFSKEAWHKDAAQRKLFLFDPRESGEETLPIYSLPSRSQWEWDGDVPGLTVPSAYAAQGLLALPVTTTPPFVAHDDPVLQVAAECPINSDCTQLPMAQYLCDPPPLDAATCPAASPTPSCGPVGPRFGQQRHGWG